MASFQAQVEGLTGLSIGTSPTTGELTEFLKDGVIDVTSKCIQFKPQDAIKFQRESGTQNSNGFHPKGAKIISVLREANADGDADGSTAWRNCRYIPAHMQSRVVDTDSLHFASIYNPVYTIDNNNTVFVYPTPDSTNDGYNVFYVNNVPTDETNSASLTQAHADIKYFPADKVYLVVMYAGIKSLQNAMSALHGNSGISTAVGLIKTAVDQAAVAAGKFLTADSDSVFGDEDTFLTANSQLTRVKEALDKAQHLMSDDASYNALTGVTDDVTNTSALYWLGDEDTEMVQAALSMVSTEIKRAQVHIQEWTSIGDMRVKEVQAALQEADGYSKEVQTRMADLGQEYQWYDKRYMQLKQEYDQAFAMMAPPQPQQAAEGRR